MADVLIDGKLPGQTEVYDNMDRKRNMIRAEDAYEDDPSEKNKAALDKATLAYEAWGVEIFNDNNEIDWDDILKDDPAFINIAKLVSDHAFDYEIAIQKKLIYLLFDWVDENHNYLTFHSEARKNYKRKLQRRVDTDPCEEELIHNLSTNANKTALRKKVRELTDQTTAEHLLDHLNTKLYNEIITY